jgi:metal-responsive CopG/Arc/MetJ family transcriptional regulator
MKQLSALIDDELMTGLDELVRLGDDRDRSYFVRQALERYLLEELPKAKKQPRRSGRAELRGLIEPKK